MKVPAVLIVDDNPVNLELYGELLDMTDYRAVLVARADQVVPTALAERPGLILLDLNLPGSSGQLVASDLKSCPELAPVPILALTAIRREGLADALERAGFAGLVSKPCGVETFLAAVQWGMAGAGEFRVFG
ncbi:MAG: response regulator [Alphaproteobacteria bacterium]|nr:response regulator [Alphaproteobacteria bacterium]